MLLLPPKARASASFEDVPRRMAMRHGRRSRSGQMSREARSRAAKPRETKRRQSLLEDAFHRAGSAAAFTAANVPLKQGQIDERPLIAVSAGNLNTAKRKRLCQDVAVSSSQYGKNTNFSPVFHLAESLAKTFCWLFLWNFKEKASTIFYGGAK